MRSIYIIILYFGILLLNRIFYPVKGRYNIIILYYTIFGVIPSVACNHPHFSLNSDFWDFEVCAYIGSPPGLYLIIFKYSDYLYPAWQLKLEITCTLSYGNPMFKHMIFSKMLMRLNRNPN